MNVVEGNVDGKGMKIGIVMSRFNDFINGKLLEAAEDCLTRHGVADDDITLFRVPGAFEIPLVAKNAAASEKFDAVICLGTVIRGATSHYDLITNEVTKGIAAASLETGLPIIYGIVTAETIEQAVERAGTKAGNRGWDAAMAAIEMADLNRQNG